jgi:DNA-binding CsgD family transcriptional regulator
MLCEQYAIADTVLERAEREARNRGWLPELLQALAFRGTSAYRQGRLADAEADTRAVLALASEHEDWSYVLHGNTTLVLTLLERGALEEAGAALRQSGLDPLAHDGVDARWLLHARGRFLCADGRPSDGLKDLLEAGARFERARQPSPALAPWRSDAALAHLALGDRVSAIRLATEELDLARAYGAPRALGIALRGAGLVHGGGPGIELLEEAVSVLGESAAALERARALVDLGAAMRREARRTEGRKHLQAGRELAHALGAVPLEERATLELRAAGARPRALMVTGRDSLTASEARIAQMAADGMANREIAQALFVSSRTVENHLARIYQKLGIHSRNKLGSAMAASEPG